MTPAALHAGERAAQHARGELGLALAEPLRDVLAVAEDRLGIPVLIDRFAQPDVAGLLLRRPDGDVFVAVNADFGSPRQRFTLAHEVGHVYMGHQPRVDLARDLFGDPRDEQEVAANYFAGEFIAPRQAVLAWLETRDLVGDAGSADTIARFGLSSGLSLAAACIRFQRAGVVSPAAGRRLLAEIAGDGAANLVRRHHMHRVVDEIEALWRRGEPSYPRVPRETSQLATAAQAAGLLDADDYAAMVPVPADDDYALADWGA